ACKGKSKTVTGGSVVDGYESSAILSPNMYESTNIGPDMLIAFATIEGNVSYRNIITGTWYIQELCKVFTAYGRRDDVLTLLCRLNKHICGNYFDEDCSQSNEIFKQMPTFMSTLKKKFYLNRNKDRHYILEIQKKTATTYNMLREIANMQNDNDK
ncbi:hypothetical protein GWI33_013522, partial [Rhynchophorus ferrugineus]